MRKTAIILFAHLPEFEARDKRFSSLSSQKATQKISKILTNHFYNLAQKTTCDTFLIDTFRQKGKGFGERITNAFVSIYAKGYENVICIGNDSPGLEISHLEKAILETEKGKVTLGPAVDGGAYLIGIPKKFFNSIAFLNVRWQSKHTYQDIVKKLCHKVEVTQLIPLLDIDNAEQIQKHQKNELIDLLIQIIQTYIVKIPCLYQKNDTSATFSETIQFRGPPITADC